MNDFEKLQRKIVEFRKKRDWGQFHNAKDLSLSLVVEAVEVLELFQWKSQDTVRRFLDKNKGKLEEEMADVLIYLFNLADVENINLKKAVEDKLVKNEKKYPVEKAKGTAKKYDDLG